MLEIIKTQRATKEIIKSPRALLKIIKAPSALLVAIKAPKTVLFARRLDVDNSNPIHPGFARKVMNKWE